MIQVNKIYNEHCLQTLKRMPDDFIDCVVTSPPYWKLRDYGVDDQIGLEPSLDEYLDKLLQITAEIKRVLKPSGILFWNHGDCYGGNSMTGGDSPKEIKQRRFRNAPHSKLTPKCLALQNYRLIIRMIDEQGWILRNIIIWEKPNAMPESVKDRFSNQYEPVFMLTKNQKYWFDLDAVRIPHSKVTIKRSQYPVAKFGGDPNNPMGKFGKGAINGSDTTTIELNPLGKNPGDVWEIPTQACPEAHFATFPTKLIKPMINAGCPLWICKKCLKPRKRITKIEYLSKGNFSKSTKINDKFTAKMKRWGDGIVVNTIGWTKCECNAGWKPGIVYDPFMGAGTTAIAAIQLGRFFIGSEINPNYVKIAYKRIKPIINQTSLLNLLEP